MQHGAAHLTDLAAKVAKGAVRAMDAHWLAGLGTLMACRLGRRASLLLLAVGCAAVIVSVVNGYVFVRNERIGMRFTPVEWRWAHRSQLLSGPSGG